MRILWIISVASLVSRKLGGLVLFSLFYLLVVCPWCGERAECCLERRSIYGLHAGVGIHVLLSVFRPWLINNT